MYGNIEEIKIWVIFDHSVLEKMDLNFKKVKKILDELNFNFPTHYARVYFGCL